MSYLDKKTVLVVDDHEDQRELIIDVLKGKYQVIEAKDGETAVEMFIKYKDTIGVVLLDLHLPDMSGNEVFQKFRQITVTELPNIIVISGLNEPEDIIDSFAKNDAFFYLEKPYSPKELVRVIDESFTAAMSPRQNKRIARDAALRRLLIDRNVRMLNERVTSNMMYGKTLSQEEAESLTLKFEDIVGDQKTKLSKIIETLEEDTGVKAPEKWDPRILFVEDELDFQELLRDYLSSKRYTIHLALSLKEAREILKIHQNLDIILLDMGLPDGYGKEIIEDLTDGIEQWYKNKNSLLTYLPDIVVHSAFIDRDTIRDIIRAGALTYINKPAPCSDVYKKLEIAFHDRYEWCAVQYLFDVLNTQEKSFRTEEYEKSLQNQS